MAARWASHLGACLLCWGCASSEPEPQLPESDASSGEQVAARERGMAVTGIMGTIPEHRIQEALEPKLPKFQRCFMYGAERVELIGGHIKFYFHVGNDGSVEWVHPRGSSIGERATEQCLLEQAAKVRFPKPKGGDGAEFAWGFELDGISGGRPPVAWDPGRVASVASAVSRDVSACGGGRYVVTAYVEPGGSVMAAGAAADSQEAAEHIDCVLQAVRGAKFPDPGSYPAKVSFELP